MTEKTSPRINENHKPIEVIFCMLFCVLLSPVLRGDQEYSALYPSVQHLKNGLHLIAHVYSGDRAVSQRTYHQVVRETDRIRDEILKHHRYREKDYPFVYVFVL